jgi:hypothetical protein
MSAALTPACHRRQGGGRFPLACFIRLRHATNGTAITATLARGGVIYASTTALATGTPQDIALHARLTVRPGRYTLRITYRRGNHTLTTREQITIRRGGPGRPIKT